VASFVNKTAPINGSSCWQKEEGRWEDEIERVTYQPEPPDVAMVDYGNILRVEVGRRKLMGELGKSSAYLSRWSLESLTNQAPS